MSTPSATYLLTNRYTHFSSYFLVFLGWFVQSKEGDITKEYNYTLVPSNNNFVEWKERTTSKGHEKKFTGLIYVGRPYLTAIDVTERRNLAYNFRSLLSRDQKGHLIAGIYYKVLMNNDEFTIFYQNMGKQRVKMNFSAFMQPVVITNYTSQYYYLCICHFYIINIYPFQINQEMLEKVQICNEQLNLPENKLLTLIQKVGQILQDAAYLPQLLDIDRCISIISANN